VPVNSSFLHFAAENRGLAALLSPAESRPSSKEEVFGIVTGKASGIFFFKKHSAKSFQSRYNNIHDSRLRLITKQVLCIPCLFKDWTLSTIRNKGVKKQHCHPNY